MLLLIQQEKKKVRSSFQQMRGMTACGRCSSSLQMQHIRRRPAEPKTQAHLQNPPLFPGWQGDGKDKEENRGSGAGAWRCRRSLLPGLARRDKSLLHVGQANPDGAALQTHRPSPSLTRPPLLLQSDALFTFEVFSRERESSFSFMGKPQVCREPACVLGAYARRHVSEFCHLCFQSPVTLTRL